MSAINGSMKGGVAIKLLKCTKDPHDSQTSLKARYKSDSHSCKTGSTDKYLADMKEEADEMEELDVTLLVASTIEMSGTTSTEEQETHD